MLPHDAINGATMTDHTEYIDNVEDAVNLTNPKMVRKLLDNGNFEVLSIYPFKDPRKIHNTRAKIKVDRFPGNTAKIPNELRYSIRRILFNRVPLQTAMTVAGFAVDEFGRFNVGSVTDAASFVNGIRDKVHIEETEIYFKPSLDAATLVRAKRDSLGYTGQITVVGGEFIPTIEKIVVQGDSEVTDFQAPAKYGFMCYDARGGIVPIPTDEITITITPNGTYRSYDDSDIDTGSFTIDWIGNMVDVVCKVEVKYKEVTGYIITVLKGPIDDDIAWVDANMSYYGSYISFDGPGEFPETALKPSTDHYIRFIPHGNPELRKGRIVLRKMGPNNTLLETIVLGDTVFLPEDMEPPVASWFRVTESEPTDVRYTFWIENGDNTVSVLAGDWSFDAKDKVVASIVIAGPLKITPSEQFVYYNWEALNDRSQTVIPISVDWELDTNELIESTESTKFREGKLGFKFRPNYSDGSKFINLTVRADGKEYTLRIEVLVAGKPPLDKTDAFEVEVRNKVGEIVTDKVDYNEEYLIRLKPTQLKNPSLADLCYIGADAELVRDAELILKAGETYERSFVVAAGLVNDGKVTFVLSPSDRSFNTELFSLPAVDKLQSVDISGTTTVVESDTPFELTYVQHTTSGSPIAISEITVTASVNGLIDLGSLVADKQTNTLSLKTFNPIPSEGEVTLTFNFDGVESEHIVAVKFKTEEIKDKTELKSLICSSTTDGSNQLTLVPVTKSCFFTYELAEARTRRTSMNVELLLANQAPVRETIWFEIGETKSAVPYQVSRDADMSAKVIASIGLSGTLTEYMQFDLDYVRIASINVLHGPKEVTGRGVYVYVLETHDSLGDVTEDHADFNIELADNIMDTFFVVTEDGRVLDIKFIDVLEDTEGVLSFTLPGVESNPYPVLVEKRDAWVGDDVTVYPAKVSSTPDGKTEIPALIPTEKNYLVFKHDGVFVPTKMNVGVAVEGSEPTLETITLEVGVPYIREYSVPEGVGYPTKIETHIGNSDSQWLNNVLPIRRADPTWIADTVEFIARPSVSTGLITTDLLSLNDSQYAVVEPQEEVALPGLVNVRVEANQTTVFDSTVTVTSPTGVARGLWGMKLQENFPDVPLDANIQVFVSGQAKDNWRLAGKLKREGARYITELAITSPTLIYGEDEMAFDTFAKGEDGKPVTIVTRQWSVSPTDILKGVREPSNRFESAVQLTFVPVKVDTLFTVTTKVNSFTASKELVLKPSDVPDATPVIAKVALTDDGSITQDELEVWSSGYVNKIAFFPSQTVRLTPARMKIVVKAMDERIVLPETECWIEEHEGVVCALMDFVVPDEFADEVGFNFYRKSTYTENDVKLNAIYFKGKSPFVSGTITGETAVEGGMAYPFGTQVLGPNDSPITVTSRSWYTTPPGFIVAIGESSDYNGDAQLTFMPVPAEQTFKLHAVVNGSVITRACTVNMSPRVDENINIQVLNTYGVDGELELRRDNWHQSDKCTVEVVATGFEGIRSGDIKFQAVKVDGTTIGEGKVYPTVFRPGLPIMLDVAFDDQTGRSVLGGKVLMTTVHDNRTIEEFTVYGKWVDSADISQLDKNVYFGKPTKFQLGASLGGTKVTGLNDYGIFSDPPEAIVSTKSLPNDQVEIVFKEGYNDVRVWSVIYGKLSNTINVQPEVYTEPEYLPTGAGVTMGTTYGSRGIYEERPNRLHLQDVNNLVFNFSGLTKEVSANIEYRVAKLPPIIVPVKVKNGKNVIPFNLPSNAKASDEVIIIIYGKNIDSAIFAESHKVYATTIVDVVTSPSNTNVKADVNTRFTIVANSTNGTIAVPPDYKFICDPQIGLKSSGIIGGDPYGINVMFTQYSASNKVAVLVHGKLSGWINISVTP